MNWHRAHPSLPGGPVGLPQVLTAAGFPIYGIIGKPQGLTLQLLGFGRRWPPSPSELLILQVTLGFVGYGYGYRSSARRSGRKLDLTTTNPDHLAVFGITPDGIQFPVDGDVRDLDGRVYTRYSSVEEAIQSTSPNHSCLIDHFFLAQDIVVAEFRYWKGPDEEWLFTLTRPGLYVSGHAWAYSRAELLRLITRIGILNEQPAIVDQYQQEMTKWRDYLHPPK